MSTTKIGPHDDVEYEVSVTVDGEQKPRMLQVHTSRKMGEASKAIQRIVDSHNRTNGDGSMKLNGFQIKDPELRKQYGSVNHNIDNPTPAPDDE